MESESDLVSEGAATEPGLELRVWTIDEDGSAIDGCGVTAAIIQNAKLAFDMNVSRSCGAVVPEDDSGIGRDINMMAKGGRSLSAFPSAVAMEE